MADAGWSYRDKDEVAEHQRHDPIDRAAQHLGLDESAVEELREHAGRRVQEAVEFVENSDEPDVASLAEHVYGDPGSEQQFERMLTGAPFGEGARE